MREAASYGIVDRRLLFDRYVHRMSHKGMALYLFLILAADREGRSFYGDRSIASILKLSPLELEEARKELIDAGLADYRRPYFWVKTLTTSLPRSRPAAGSAGTRRPASEPEPLRGIVPAGLKLLIKSLEDGR
jgi:hypothetical protein